MQTDLGSGTNGWVPREEEAATVGSCFLIKSLGLIRSRHSELFKKLLISLTVTAWILTIATRPAGSGGPPTRAPRPHMAFPPLAPLPSVLFSNTPGAGSRLWKLPPTGTLFSQLLLRVACPLASFCPYPNVTISATPSPDTTPKITNHPPTYPCRTHSQTCFSFLLDMSPANTHIMSLSHFSPASLHAEADCTRTGILALSVHRYSPSSRSPQNT